MKVYEAISDSNIGGAGILLVTRLKHSNRKEFQTTVLLPKNSELKSRLREISIPTIEIDGGADRSFALQTIASYCAIFRRDRPQLVNCHGCFSARIAAKICRIPCVYTRHCAYPPKKWQTMCLGKAMIGAIQSFFCDTVIAVADAAKQNLLDMGVPEKKIHVIINGVDGLRKIDERERESLRSDLNFPSYAIVIGICARLEPCKGHFDLLKAAELLLQCADRYRFLIVGSGSMEKELKMFCQSHHLNYAVRFVGFQKDVAPYVNLFDILANCSVGTETSSLAISEAMSLGIPAVVSDYGGNPHMVKNETNGLLYPTHNYTALAEQIHRIANDFELYQKLSVGARERFLSEFQATHMVKQTEALYRSVIRRDGSTRKA